MDFSGGGGSGSAASTAVVVNQRSVALKLGAEVTMCNKALRMTVTDMQRRPMSTFSGYSLDSETNSGGAVGVSSTDDIVIQVSMKYEWNVNTYTQAVTAAGGNGNAPGTLGDILKSGTLMYISGEDANGGPYVVADVIQASSERQGDGLQIGSQWDYNILESPLPETSKTAEGSILFRVASTASNLKLFIVSPDAGQDVTSGDIQNGDVTLYSLDLT